MRRARSASEREFATSVGLRIQNARQRGGFKQVDLARALSITPQQLYNYEVGLCSCPLFRLYEIAQILGVSLQDFLVAPSITAVHL
jgi:ribosome-binding protein aMBF1 (putative translation factor)